MLDSIKKEANRTYTENGAATYETTESDCLDLFATIGALRHEREEEIITRFTRAFTENPDHAMKLLFFARDIRGGLGERKVFRTIFRWLAKNEPQTVRKNISFIAEFGRYDDLLALLGTPCEKDMSELIKAQFVIDRENLIAGRPVSLLAKWLPSVNASNTETVRHAKKIARALELSDRQYRKALADLRAEIRILENALREKDYSFDYQKQPSRAMYKYRRAFMRNDKDRYLAFISGVNTGEAKLHADNVAPYELVEPFLGWGPFNEAQSGFMRPVTPEEKDVLNATWTSLPDFGGEENMLAVVDTSGSMYFDLHPLPAAVALSLGLYFAERNRGAFHNHFIEFSKRPRLIEIKGETFADRLRYVASFDEIANTDLEAVFELILRVAINNHVPQEELPTKLVIISDMEFDCCIDNADAVHFRHAKEKYEAEGYKLPEVVFWNVASRNRQQPVTKNEQGAALVSGVTPRLFSMIASGELSPYKFMLEVLESERYACIVA